MTTAQEKFWQSDFGDDYIARNTAEPAALDQIYFQRYGLSRSAMNQEFLADLKIRNILEVGCNIGNQLALLKNQGYADLTGLEINYEAATVAQKRLPQAKIIEGSAFALPFSDNQFDLVFTSGVLIHIHPDDLKTMMSEMVRVTKKYLWGFEYYAPQMTTIEYRGHRDRLWKNNFAEVYQTFFPKLKLLKEKQYPYQDRSGNIDSMFLLSK
jgi:pseudaminic acid biosynthesis-associated methylase